jgi:hypothetical protein
MQESDESLERNVPGVDLRHIKFLGFNKFCEDRNVHAAFQNGMSPIQKP